MEPRPLPLTLALMLQGTHLMAWLSGVRAMHVVGGVPDAGAALAAIGCAPAAASVVAPPRGTPPDLLGHLIFTRLLPTEVGVALARSGPRALDLQLSPSLLAVPWELAYDGEQFVGEKFEVARQLIRSADSDAAATALPDPEADHDVLRVLVIDGTRADDGGSRTALLHGLARLDQVTVTVAAAASIGRQRVLELAAKHDIVHWIGPDVGAGGALLLADGKPLPLQTLQSSDRRPRLLLLAGGTSLLTGPNAAALAAAAGEAGLSLLAMVDTDEAGRLAFVHTLYQQLAMAAPPATAVSRARTASRLGAADGRVPLAALYAEGAAPLVARHRRWREGDNWRQVTVMSFDLVGSTSLSHGIGTERYSALLPEFHRTCAEIVIRYGGTPTDPQANDGVICYFGFPVARERDAVQAVRAGLDILGAVAHLGLQVRIGINTGEIVVRDGTPYGPPIHLAARLQAKVATPGTLVISNSTRALTGARFDCEAVALPELKGFDGPLTRSERAYRVLREARQHDRFDSSTQLTPFVGREREIAWLDRCWQRAAAGSGCAVTVSGEAGIGKSRLLREFRRRLADRGVDVFECRCAPDHAGSAFWPVIEFLRRLLRIEPGSASDVAGVARILGDDVGIPDAAALLADLLSLPLGGRADPQISAERRRQLTLDLLSNLVRRHAANAPVCLMVDDVHWIDPSSKEFLDRVIAECASAPLLVVLARRSDSDLPAPDERVLAGLPADAAHTMVLDVCGDEQLPADVVRKLVECGDGVPLFIEESTRMAMVARLRAAAGTGTPETNFRIPETIQELLLARLDQLGPAKHIAQVGGTIGREFPRSLLTAVLSHEDSPVRADALETRLATLIGSGLLLQRDDPPNERLVFKHALVRDAAYRSLLEVDRRRLHQVIAQVIRLHYRQLAEAQPEVVAHHLTEAGAYSEAIGFWEQAARHAASRSANQEAIGHLESALTATARLAAGAERDRLELRLRLQLAGRRIVAEGYGAASVEAAYSRAAELCLLLDDEPSLLKVQLGLEGCHFMRGEFARAHEFAQRAAALAIGIGDSVHAIQATWAMANILMHQGEMLEAVRLMDVCLADYDKLQHRAGAAQDPGVICLCYSAWGKWELGYPDQARERALKVVALAERLGHKFSLGEAYGFRSTIHYFRGEDEEALEFARRAIEVCEHGGFTVWLAHAQLMHGRMRVGRGDAGGIDEMRAALDLWRSTGAVVTQPFYLALQAEALAELGLADEGFPLLLQALQIVQRCGERYYEAEIKRLAGELSLRRGSEPVHRRHSEALNWLRGALACAQSQQLHSLALRCATSLARLLRDASQPEEALRLLQPEYAWFSEGQDSRDLRAARQLLQQLQTGPASDRTRVPA